MILLSKLSLFQQTMLVGHVVLGFLATNAVDSGWPEQHVPSCVSNAVDSLVEHKLVCVGVLSAPGIKDQPIADRHLPVALRGERCSTEIGLYYSTMICSLPILDSSIVWRLGFD